MDLHILSDPVSEFWKCPKKFLLLLFGIFLPHLLTCLVLSDPLKLFQKSKELTYMAYVLYI